MKSNLWKISSSFCATLLGLSFLIGTQAKTGGYVENDLVVNKVLNGVPTLVDSHNVTHIAKFFDPNLVNPWGIATSATSPFWSISCASVTSFMSARILPGVETMIGTLACITIADIKIAAESAKTCEIFIWLS